MIKQTKDTGNVHQLHEGKATEVKPPETWALKLTIDHGRGQSTYFQKADANTPMVRIVDVLADFAERDGLPAGAAVDSFLAKVNVPLLQDVYWLKENHFAELVGAAHMYGQLTEVEAQKKNRESADDIDERVSRLFGVTPSVSKWTATPLDALKQHIQDHGPERSDRSLYAVSHATANRLWGWGEVVAAQGETQAAPAMNQPVSGVTKPKKGKWKEAIPDWPKQRLQARRMELEKQNVMNPVAQMSKESGLPAREIYRRVNEVAGVIAHVAGDINLNSAKKKTA